MSSSPQAKRARLRLERPFQTACIHLSCFPVELENLKTMAKNAGKTLSSFVRDSCLAPNHSQSQANVEPNGEKIESLQLESTQEVRQKFSARHLEQKKPSNRETIGGGSDEVRRRTGHQTGCTCFACRRLRELLQVNDAAK